MKLFMINECRIILKLDFTQASMKYILILLRQMRLDYEAL